MIRTLTLGALALLFCTPASAAPITVGGILFPGGTASFADLVVGFSPGSGVGRGTTVGCPNGLTFNDPQAALGLPNYTGCSGAVSLGDANFGPAELIVRFTDNSLTTSGDATPDLHIFEVGTDVERFLVSISQDGMNWIELGSLSGQPTSIDIDGVSGVVPGALYSFVRLRDDPSVTSPFSQFFAEADIDAIGAISSGRAVPVPEPATLALLALGLAAGSRLRRRAPVVGVG